MTRLGLIACAFSIASGVLVLPADAQLTALTEGFEDVTTLSGAGWMITNNSSPIGNHDWNQGIDIADGGTLGVDAQSGPPNSFIQTDFQAGSLSSVAIVSDWLITPVLSLQNGGTISFYSQTTTSHTQFPNELQVWESLSGSSAVNVGSAEASPGGDFTNKLLDINPGALNASGTADGYPTTWTQFTLKLSDLASPTDGRIGFRYYLPNNVTKGTVVGIDTFSYTTVPEPSQLALLALGSLALIVMRPSASRLLRASS